VDAENKTLEISNQVKNKKGEWEKIILGENDVALDINSAALSNNATWRNISTAKKTIKNINGIDREGVEADVTENTRFVAYSRSTIDNRDPETGEIPDMVSEKDASGEVKDAKGNVKMEPTPLDVNGERIAGTFEQNDLYVLDGASLSAANADGKSASANHVLSLKDKNGLKLTTRTVFNNQEASKNGIVDLAKLAEANTTQIL
jgi:hypothetical protein